MNLLPPLIALGLYEALLFQGPEYLERHRAWSVARAYCVTVGKPLLRVGIRRGFLEPPNGDATLDIDPVVLGIPGGVLGDERNMHMFADRQFGVCFNECTLEHLRKPEDLEPAVRESLRVADWAFLLFPHSGSIAARLWPGHYLQIESIPGGLRAYSLNQPDGERCEVAVPGAQLGPWGMLVTGSTWRCSR